MKEYNGRVVEIAYYTNQIDIMSHLWEYDSIQEVALLLFKGNQL